MLKFEELHIKYPLNGKFTLSNDESLLEKCNAPNNYGGIYLIYNEKELLYVGTSGRKSENTLIVRKSGLGDIKDRIVNGYHPKFGKIKRSKAFLHQMKIENISTLTIEWYVTFDFEKVFDFPTDVESILLNQYIDKFNSKPIWHK